MSISFCACWLTIGLVSAIDTYYTIACRATIAADELNPLCRWILDRSGRGDVAPLVGLKVAGTVLALGSLALLYRQRPDMARVVAAVLAGGQLAVLAWLLGGV